MPKKLIERAQSMAKTIKNVSEVVTGVSARTFHRVVEGRARKNEGLAEEVLTIGSMNATVREQKIYELESFIANTTYAEPLVVQDFKFDEAETDLRDWISEEETKEQPNKESIRHWREILHAMEKRKKLLEANTRFEERKKRIIQSHKERYEQKEREVKSSIETISLKLAKAKARQERFKQSIEGVRIKLRSLIEKRNAYQNRLSQFEERTGLGAFFARRYHWLTIAQLKGALGKMNQEISGLESNLEARESKYLLIQQNTAQAELALKTVTAEMQSIKNKGERWGKGKE